MLFIESGRVSSFILLIILWVAYIFYMEQAKKGKVPKTRRFPALEAMDEAVGRAAEMGRPIHFSPLSARVMHAEGGQTVASMAVLHIVARKCIQKGVRLISSVGNPQVLPLMEEAIETAYRMEGKPDAFVREDIFFFSGAYRTSVIDLIMRERPATCFLIGPAYGETLLFAETGARVGAMQIGGSARVGNLPFLAAVCDYCFFGEELYAAGANLSQDEIQLGCIRGQDIGKIIGLILLVVGIIALNIGFPFMTDLLRW